jgi:hypothetical protein
MRHARLHALFLKNLPRLEAHAAFALRHIHCDDTRADMTAELVAIAWCAFVRLTRRGKKPEEFITTLALRCSQAVRAGRRLAGFESSRDALSRVAAVRHNFAVVHLGDEGLPAGVTEALADCTRGRVPELVAFRVDFPAWRASIGRRNRAVLDALASGEGTCEVAARFKICPARVSQLRREFLCSWQSFHRGE